MKPHHLPIALLLLPWLAAAENGITALSQQQQFLNQRDQQWQQQRQLNNQQTEQRRRQQQYQLNINQPKMLPENTNGGLLLQNGNPRRDPFERTTPAVPKIP